MKALLGCLMCLVFTLTRTFAISGGPQFPGGTNVAGVYAGVLKRPSDTIPPSFPAGCPLPAPGCSANSLGVFSITVPTSGISSGTFVMFSQGRVFSGTIRGAADPGRSKLTGVLNATFDFTVTRTFINPVTGEVTTTTESVTAQANGGLKANITSVRSQSSFGATAVRLADDATLNIDHGEVNADNQPCITCYMTLKVRGFKQTNTAPTTSTTG
ncbi:MAG TPA: hypothetical protein VKE30_03070 [Chthoniobacterales bacterium]|nr:hypothetical protein [Chthoniobacterales bacterium]